MCFHKTANVSSWDFDLSIKETDIAIPVRHRNFDNNQWICEKACVLNSLTTKWRQITVLKLLTIYNSRRNLPLPFQAFSSLNDIVAKGIIPVLVS